MRLMLLVVALLAPAAGRASTQAAWAASNAAARAACLKAAGLARARASTPVIFSDAPMKTALLVTGTYPQPHMRGAQGQMLCLYDRRTGRAEAVEAAGWRAR